MAGTDLYWGHGEVALQELVETLQIPVFLNGLARGCVAADHELCLSRARSRALREADVAVVVGVPMDFRLGFGGAFGEQTEIVVADVAEPARRHPREVAVELYGSLSETLRDLRAAAGGGALQSARLGGGAARGGGAAARGGARGARGRARAAAPDAGVRRAPGSAGARRGGGRGRRRLRLLRRQGGGQLRAGVLA